MGKCHVRASGNRGRIGRRGCDCGGGTGRYHDGLFLGLGVTGTDLGGARRRVLSLSHRNHLGRGYDTHHLFCDGRHEIDGAVGAAVATAAAAAAAADVGWHRTVRLGWVVPGDHHVQATGRRGYLAASFCPEKTRDLASTEY